jgi:uncharacterized protein YgiB involved in biofilm formation
MKKLIAITIAATMLTATAASADGRYRRYQNHGHHHHRGGPNWVAPLVGGLVIGGLLAGGAYAAQPYYAPQYYAPQYVPSCWRQPVYDYYGQQVGWQRVCQ